VHRALLGINEVQLLANVAVTAYIEICE